MGTVEETQRSLRGLFIEHRETDRLTGSLLSPDPRVVIGIFSNEGRKVLTKGGDIDHRGQVSKMKGNVCLFAMEKRSYPLPDTSNRDTPTRLNTPRRIPRSTENLDSRLRQKLSPEDRRSV